MMRIIRNITVIGLIIWVLTEGAFGAGTRSSARSPSGRGVIPPSSTRSGLIRSPNPFDTSSYSTPGIVTGNIAGNKYFRGVVPYNSFSYFSGPTGTESVDSFLRYSGGGELYGQYTGKLTPFYSPSRTVTYTSPGVGVVGSQTTYQDYLEEEARLSASPESKQVSPQLPMFVKPSSTNELSGMYLPGARPMSMSLEEMEKLISAEGEISLSVKQKLEKQGVQAEQEQMQQLEEALKQAGSKVAELERKLEYKGNMPEQPAGEQMPAQGIQKTSEQLNIQPSGKQTNEEASTESELRPDILSQKPLDIFEQMRQRLAAPQQGPEPTISLQPTKTAEEPSVAEGKEEKGQKSLKETGNQFEKLSPEEISNKAKSILGEYKTFASYSQDKFNRYMLAGERYLKEGRYYLAADAYTLASVYKPENPLAYAGKSHALFAAGEYMSSALYLSRALTIFPEYARFKIDLISMVGDKDKLESRIADVKEWLTRSDSAELHFLLAYVYYQMDRPEEAKKSIDAAYAQMPDAPAVRTLKDAIYAAQK